MLSSGIPITQLHISLSEKLVYCFLLLSALLAGLLLQHMLHASVCFTSCNCSDPSVLVAEKSRSQTEILMNTGTHLKKKNAASEEHWNLLYCLHCYTIQGQKHPLQLLLLEQPANVHWFSVKCVH